MKRIIFFLLFSFFLTVPNILFGQQYTLHYFGEDQGLKYTHSRNVVQDKQGYIWIASDNGIRRFDGNKFLSFNSDIAADVNVPIGDIRRMFILKNGDLALLKFDNNDIGLFNPRTFAYKNLDFSQYNIGKNRMISAYQFSDSLLYIGIQSPKGVLILSFDGSHLKELYQEKEKNRKVSDLISIYENSIYISPVAKNRYLFFDAQKGYFDLNNKTGNLTPLVLPKKIVSKDPWPSFMMQDQKGHWLISFGIIPGIYTLDSLRRIVPDKHFDQTVEYRYVNPGGKGKLIFSVYNDSSMYFMVYNPDDQSSYRIKGVRFDSWAVMNAWSNNVDKYLYISGDKGLIYAKASDYQIKSFLVKAPKNGVGLSIRGMAKIGKDKVLISTERKGLFLYDRSSEKTMPLSVPNSWPADLKPVTFCRNMIKDSRGEIYLSAYANSPKTVTPSGYLITYNPLHGFVNHHKFPFRIENMIWESDTSILAGTRSHIYRIGLYPKIHYSSVKLGADVKDPVDFFVEKMTRTGHRIYVATNQGLFVKKMGEEGLIKIHLPRARVQHYLDVVAGKKGGLWIGTEGDGLYYYNPEKGTLKKFQKKNGINSDIVCGIIPEDSNHLWISTYSGLYLLNTKHGYARSFQGQNKIPQNEFNRYSYLTLDKKDWLFGTMNGVVDIRQKKSIINSDDSLSILFSSAVFRPEWMKKDTTIYSLGQMNGKLKLAASNRHIRISFGILQPQLTGTPPLYYRMPPSQNYWYELSESNELNLNYLSPGDYRLQLAFNPGSKVYEVNFRAGYFIYEHWWFRILLAFVLLALATYLLYIFFDRRLAHEKARQMNENENFRRRLFTYIVHEFKTPLTVIKGVSGKMNHSEPKPEWKENVQSIQRQSEQMNELVEQMLELNRMDAGSWKPELKVTNVPVFVGRICAQLQSLAEEMDIRLVCSSSVKKSFQLTDVSKLRAILNNLITNALKYSPVQSTVSLCFELTDKEWSITVSDQGQGISDNDKAHIFELFYKGKESSGGKMSHSGVGLAYVKTAVEALNGRLDVFNDNGAVFNVIFPVQKIDELSEIPEPVVTKNKKTVTNNGTYSILLAEDSEEIAQYVLSCFSTDIFEIQWKKNGLEGLKYANTHIPDLVITDARMPEMNGFELIKQLKKEELTSHIPVIMLTALSGEENRLKGLESGADAYIPKPFSEKELTLTVENILNTIEKQKKQAAALLTGQNSKQATGITETDELTANYFIKRINNCLEQNYGNSQFTVDKMAELLRLSRSQMRRKVISVSGLNPSDMLRKYRLNKAANMLLDKSLSISEITFACGFSDSSYFSKLFQKEFEMSPTAYREHLK